MSPPLLTANRYSGSLAGALLALPATAIGAEAVMTQAGSDAWFWNLVIAAIVLVFSAASAALPLAALRHWHGGWRLGAMLPLCALLAWAALILLSKALDADSHRLWPFEIFAWAMLNMVYMVGLMTSKRIFDKADNKNTLSD